ncbi:hypothetical protein KKH30_03835, partial [Candidatus Micrarchaeota archaeon]|nr:hypothetical protein [Candidatus Micrarchaeota archaeon]MBU1939869.1 hypothetical protein [Candidatus Micrarchaeota archaeon]
TCGHKALLKARFLKGASPSNFFFFFLLFSAGIAQKRAFLNLLFLYCIWKQAVLGCLLFGLLPTLWAHYSAVVECAHFGESQNRVG